MSASSSSLGLDPALLARIADLELVARLVVEGARLGAHRSPFTGTGAEFQQMRPYLPGDDLKHLDWKHYARTDRLFTRVYRETTEWPVMLALDTSRSMAFTDSAGVSKLRVAQLLAAALTYLLVQQGEAVGLASHSTAAGPSLPARTGRVHLVRMLGTLSTLQAEGLTDLDGTIHGAAARLGRRGCVVLISDLYGSGEWQPTLRQARRMGHEVVIFHVLADRERRLQDDGDVEYRDLETGARVVTAATAHQPYAQQLDAFIAEQRAFAREEGVTFVPVDTRAPLDGVLRAFTQQRAAQAGVPR